VLREYKKAGKEGWGVVLRVPVLYGQAESPSESAVNVLMDAVWKAQEKDATVHMDHWALRYPTNTEDVGRVCQGTSFSKPHPFPIFVFPIHFSLRVTLTQFCAASDPFCRYCGQVHRHFRQSHSSYDSTILFRRQIHQIRDNPAVRRDYGLATC
jgi:hypothetical protein